VQEAQAFIDDILKCVHMNTMRENRFNNAIRQLAQAISEMEAALLEMETDRDPLASHIFTSRRHYRHLTDTKSGKRRETAARLSYNEACGLGFRGSFDEWERLMGAAARR
jgi:hypothetical protein